MNLESFKLQPFYAFDKEWAILTAGTKEKFNSMTISWGSVGTIWGKPVVTIYVRPNRYTYEWLEKSEYFTLSFYEEYYREDLRIMGSKSGRNEDKVALTRLTPQYWDRGVSYQEAKLTLFCRKIYTQKLETSKIVPSLQEEIEKYYQKEPVHQMYLGEVLDMVEKGS